MKPLELVPKLYCTKLLQNVREHDAFLQLLKSERVRSYLEIGSAYGGSLWKVAHILPIGTRLVSVDFAVDQLDSLPHLQECVGELNRVGYDAHLIIGDSADEETVAKVLKLGPFDCVFIDGAHTLEAVTNDWQNYGPMGRLVAFHDIAWNDTWRSSVPGRPFKAMGVPTLWNELKKQYRHQEFKLQVPNNYYGIGIFWRD